MSGGAMKRNLASLSMPAVLICCTPWTSISKMQISPFSRTSSTAAADVPYMFPCTCACSMNLPASTSAFIVSMPTKWYATPSASPGRGPRVVCETLKPKRPGIAARSRSMSVPLPTPEGPQIISGCSSTVSVVSSVAGTGAGAGVGSGRLANRHLLGTASTSVRCTFCGTISCESLFSWNPKRRQKASYCLRASASFVSRKLPGRTSSRGRSAGTEPSCRARSVRPRPAPASLPTQSPSVLASESPRSARPLALQTSSATRSLLKLFQTPSEASRSQSPRRARHSETSGAGAGFPSLRLKDPSA
mmetsp:Transcript_8861/g.25959  ORF Transcript_8861/g.25959 Transcript_8861/m.25959 type:complete len:304 (-) Transcript_8861:541-1452(-)